MTTELSADTRHAVGDVGRGRGGVLRGSVVLRVFVEALARDPVAAEMIGGRIDGERPPSVDVIFEAVSAIDAEISREAPRGLCPMCGYHYRVSRDGSLHGHEGGVGPGGGCNGRRVFPVGLLLHGEGTTVAGLGCQCWACGGTERPALAGLRYRYRRGVVCV